MQASHQWATRPEDQRFLSLTDMLAHFERTRSESHASVVSSRALTVEPDGHKGLVILDRAGHAFHPTNWAFGQLAQRAEAPAGYLRTLPAPIAADALNYGLQFKRDIEEIGVLTHRNGDSNLVAVTGPGYGRIWNAEILRHLVDKFGDGVTGFWRVPGEFGKQVEVTKQNTTLYAGDRDMFVFLADEENRIEVPDRRNGQPGSMARGFFVWNSEVGSCVYGMATFLFDYVCANRIVWGATEYKEIRMRHTSGAPDRFVEEIRPALVSYSQSSASNIVDAIAQAKKDRLDGSDGSLDEFLAKRFGKRMVEPLKALHMTEENRPIENRWDVVTAVTARARQIEYQDERVALERQAGELLTV